MNTTNPTDAVSILRKDLQDLCSYIPDNCPALHQRMRKALAATERAAIQPAGDAEPAAWIRKTDITEWTDTEPETDGWTPLYLAPAAPVQAAPELTVWEGVMPESNGKSNFTALLIRKGASLVDTNSLTISQSEYPDRVRYEADCVRFLIGELATDPCILDYASDKHSGYLAPAAQAAPDARKLQWSLPMPPNSEIGYDYVSAQTPFGRILITWEGWKDDPAYRIDEHPIEPAVFWTGYSLAETVAYAEDQYLAAIGSAAPAAQAASRDDQCKTCGAFVCCDHAQAVQAAPAFDATQPCLPYLTMCPRCKNPHNACDQGAPEVKASELPPLPEPEYDYYDIKGYDEGQMHAYGQACIDNERVSAAQWKSLYDAAIQVAESGKVIAGVRERLGIASELPPLPQPVRMSSDQSYLGYTADQLHAYVLADRAARASELPSDAEIIAACHSVGIDTDPSIYGFPELQVKTNVPGIRKIIKALAARSPVAAPTVHSIFDWERINDLEATIKSMKKRGFRSPVAAPQPDVSARDAKQLVDNWMYAFNVELGGPAYDALRDSIKSRAAPESAEPSAFKDHNVRELVNDLRATALEFHATGQLRERISGAVQQFLATSSAAKGEAQ